MTVPAKVFTTTLVSNGAEAQYGKGAFRGYLTDDEIAKNFPNGLKFSQGIKVLPTEQAKLLEKTPYFGKQFGALGTFKPTTEVQRVKMMGEEGQDVKAAKKDEAKVNALVAENEDLKKKLAALEAAKK